MQARGELEHLGREVDPDDVPAALRRSGSGVARPGGDVEDRGARGHRGGVEQGGDRARGDRAERRGDRAPHGPCSSRPARTHRRHRPARGDAISGVVEPEGASREDGRVLAFLGISLVVIMTPGQDTALTIRNTLVGGRRNGLRTALGVVLRPARLGARRQHRARRPAGRVRARVRRDHARRRRLPDRARRPLAARRDPWRPQPTVSAPAPAGRGFRQGLAEQPRQPEDGGVLHRASSPSSRRPRAARWRRCSRSAPCSPRSRWSGSRCTRSPSRGRATLLARPRVRRALDAVTGTALVALGAPAHSRASLARR